MKCVIPSCKTFVWQADSMCYRHWSSIPRTLRERVLRLDREAPGSAEHVAALMDAYESVLPAHVPTHHPFETD